MDTTVASYWRKVQASLFPGFAQELGATTEKHQKLIVSLDIIKLEDHLHVDPYPTKPGRPKLDATAMARAFVAKAVLNLPTTRGRIDRLDADPVLRRICGFESRARVPCEASFSNWFSDFADKLLAERVHDALVREAHEGIPIHNVSRDSTAIEAREVPAAKLPKKIREKKKRGRPKKREVRAPPEPSRLERQLTMTTGEQLADLPTACDDVFTTNAKGISTGWIGYKLHIDTAEGGVPVSCVLTVRFG